MMKIEKGESDDHPNISLEATPWSNIIHLWLASCQPGIVTEVILFQFSHHQIGG